MISPIIARLRPMLLFTRLWRTLLRGSVYIDKHCVVTVGKNFRTGRNVTIVLSGVSKLTIGDDVYIGDNSSLRMYNSEVRIGTNCRLANNVVVASSGYTRSGDGRLYIESGKIIVIGRSCFIGSNVVLSGTARVPDFSTIGANTYVGKDLQKSGLFVGSPVKWIRGS